jgi:hypothetical protein
LCSRRSLLRVVIATPKTHIEVPPKSVSSRSETTIKFVYSCFFVEKNLPIVCLIFPHNSFPNSVKDRIKVASPKTKTTVIEKPFVVLLRLKNGIINVVIKQIVETISNMKPIVFRCCFIFLFFNA